MVRDGSATARTRRAARRPGRRGLPAGILRRRRGALTTGTGLTARGRPDRDRPVVPTRTTPTLTAPTRTNESPTEPVTTAPEPTTTESATTVTEPSDRAAGDRHHRDRDDLVPSRRQPPRRPSRRRRRTARPGAGSRLPWLWRAQRCSGSLWRRRHTKAACGRRLDDLSRRSLLALDDVVAQGSLVTGEVQTLADEARSLESSAPDDQSSSGSRATRAPRRPRGGSRGGQEAQARLDAAERGAARVLDCSRPPRGRAAPEPPACRRLLVGLTALRESRP